MNKIETITIISENNENKAKVILNILGKIEILIVSFKTLHMKEYQWI